MRGQQIGSKPSPKNPDAPCSLEFHKNLLTRQYCKCIVVLVNSRYGKLNEVRDSWPAPASFGSDNPCRPAVLKASHGESKQITPNQSDFFCFDVLAKSTEAMQYEPLAENADCAKTLFV
jgi:hypothetical protein